MEPSEFEENLNCTTLVEEAREFIRRECLGEAHCWYNKDIDIPIPGEVCSGHLQAITDIDPLFQNLAIEELKLTGRVLADNTLIIAILAKSLETTYLRKWVHKPTYEDSDTLQSKIVMRTAHGKSSEVKELSGSSMERENYVILCLVCNILMKNGIGEFQNQIIQNDLQSREEFVSELNSLRQQICLNGSIIIKDVDDGRNLFSAHIAMDEMVICYENKVIRITKNYDLVISSTHRDGKESVSKYSHNSINFVPQDRRERILKWVRYFREKSLQLV